MTEEDKNKWREILDTEQKDYQKYNQSYNEYLEKLKVISKKNLEKFVKEIESLNEVLKEFHLSFEIPITHNQTTMFIKAIAGMDEEEINKEKTSPIHGATSDLSTMYDDEGKLYEDKIKIFAFLSNEEISYQCIGDLIPKKISDKKSKFLDEDEDVDYNNFKDLVDDFLKSYKRQIIIHKEYMEKNNKI